MTERAVPQPDVTLVLDLDGIIREATLSPALAGENIDTWRGRPWTEVVGDAGEKIARMMRDTQQSGISAFRQITQRFPSGLELPMEFTTVLLGGRRGMLAIGKNLQAVAELQARLISAQQTIERDYWKLRDIETRYRLVIEDSNEAVLLVRVTDLKIIEANRAAASALSIVPRRPDSLASRDLLLDIAPRERAAISAMLSRVRDEGKAPGIPIHLGPESKPWMLRGSLVTSDGAPVFLLRMTPVSNARGPDQSGLADIDEMLDWFPDGVVVTDETGVIRHANRAFRDMVETGARPTLKGQRLDRFLSRPGADLSVLVANVERHGGMRLLSTVLQGEMGGETEVEISATSHDDEGSTTIVLAIRNVARRLSATGAETDGLHASLSAITDEVGKTPLRRLVKRTVEVVENHYVRAALELAEGNRTSAAEILGLSRQSLYAKLDRYSLAQREPGNRETIED